MKPCSDVLHYPIDLEFLPDKFTLPAIHLYQAVLGKSLDSRNFSKKLMATEVLKKLKEKKSIGAHRAPYLYNFNKKEYKAALKTGEFFIF
ncbi:MAG: NrtR DNA-binding winged helix domain-containing protein [Flavisolibacter sp.]